MFGFGRFGRMYQQTQRLLAAVGVAFLLGFQIFSAAYIAHEADHECCGDGCPVCVQLQQCVANFQLIGSGLEADATSAPVPIITADQIVPVEVLPPPQSLVALKVQFNE